jgi:3-methyladenine DNA glycosylase AlkD
MIDGSDEIERILKLLRDLEDENWRDNMARFGIPITHALGISMPKLKQIAKEFGKNHDVALKLWENDYHEAKIIAVLLDEPLKLTEDQMDRWIYQCYSWDLTDCCCLYLFHKSPIAYQKAAEWVQREEEFVKRGGFSLMATLAVHDKKAQDEKFEFFFPLIKEQANDNRNFVKKAVNWALRAIGKRNLVLNSEAIKISEDLMKETDKTAHWIGMDAEKELKSEKIVNRIKKKKH